ncbi:hypothetical protein ACFL0Y_03020 [Patescibacteria group bacterium]
MFRTLLILLWTVLVIGGSIYVYENLVANKTFTGREIEIVLLTGRSFKVTGEKVSACFHGEGQRFDLVDQDGDVVYSPDPVMPSSGANSAFSLKIKSLKNIPLKVQGGETVSASFSSDDEIIIVETWLWGLGARIPLLIAIIIVAIFVYGFGLALLL